MLIPHDRKDCVNHDTRELVLDENHFITATESYDYLGYHIHYSLSAFYTILERIKAAERARGALSKVFRSKYYSLEAKGRIYLSTVVPILLNGCENWALTHNDIAYIRTTHRSCVRMMTRKPIWRQRLAHEPTSALEKSLGIRDIMYYYRRRTLRWIGKIIIMPHNGHPHQLLHSWAAARRKTGRPQMSVRAAHANLINDSNILDKSLRGIKNIAAHETAWKNEIEKIATYY